MASEGPNSPSTAAEDTSIGTKSWANYTNVTSSNNADATVTPAFLGTAYYIKATNFGFSIPAGATIDGIVYEAERATDTATVIRDTQATPGAGVRIVKGGTISGDNKGTGDSWATADQYDSYGGASDLWGVTWASGDINGSTFGVVQSAYSFHGGGAAQAQVDHMRLTVYYTEAGGVPQLALTGVGTQ